MNEPVAITSGVSDGLLFMIDGEGGRRLSVTLTAGEARTGAEIAADIRRTADVDRVTPLCARTRGFSSSYRSVSKYLNDRSS
jgi:hypothetical protein